MNPNELDVRAPLLLAQSVEFQGKIRRHKADSRDGTVGLAPGPTPANQ
jgi:hypothetical protein